MTPLAYSVLSLYGGEFAANPEGYVLDSSHHRSEPVTPELLEWAFLNGHSISGYMAVVADDQVTTTVGAIDLDEGTVKDGGAIRDVLKAQAIPSLLVESRRGCHLWTFHHGDGTHGSEKYMPVPAGVVRSALRNAATLAGYEGPKVEVFPKASQSPWGVGALRMPLMPHPKTGEKYPAYDMDGVKIEKTLDLVNAISSMTAPYKAVYALSGVETAPVPYPTALGPYRRSDGRTDDAPSVVDLLAEMGVLVNGKRAVRCPWHSDQHASLSIAPDGQRVWCKSPSCPVYNGGRGLGSFALRAMLSKAQ